MGTRVFRSEEIETSIAAAPVSGMYTQESRRVNALSLLNELVKPVRKPQEPTIRFQPVPLNPSARDRAALMDCTPWQVFLLPSGNVDLAMPLELHGDVVLGSNPEQGRDLDVNLEKFGGYTKGVSRRHVLLRPTRGRLYAIDLNSTNGTWLNGMPAGQARAHELHDGDLLTLGQLHLQIRIVQRPASAMPKTQ